MILFKNKIIEFASIILKYKDKMIKILGIEKQFKNKTLI